MIPYELLGKGLNMDLKLLAALLGALVCAGKTPRHLPVEREAPSVRLKNRGIWERRERR